MKLYYIGTEFIDYILDIQTDKQIPVNSEGYFEIDEIDSNLQDINDIVKDFWKIDINGARRFWYDNGNFQDRKPDDPPWEEWDIE